MRATTKSNKFPEIPTATAKNYLSTSIANHPTKLHAFLKMIPKAKSPEFGEDSLKIEQDIACPP